MWLIAMASAHASACPHGAVCVASQTRVTVEAVRSNREIATAPTTFVVPRNSAPPPTSPRSSISPALAQSLRVHVVPRAGEIQMPWIWQVLRREVYTRMPTYHEQRFTMTLEPVVVSSPSDTVPGVGVGGVF
jgi:hypothetical protein